MFTIPPNCKGAVEIAMTAVSTMVCPFICALNTSVGSLIVCAAFKPFGMQSGGSGSFKYGAIYLGSVIVACVTSLSAGIGFASGNGNELTGWILGPVATVVKNVLCAARELPCGMVAWRT